MTLHTRNPRRFLQLRYNFSFTSVWFGSAVVVYCLCVADPDFARGFVHGAQAQKGRHKERVLCRAGNEIELWLDLRRRDPSELAVRAAVAGMTAPQASTGPPSPQEALQQLFIEVKAKLESIGVQPPQGRGVDGLLIDERFVDDVLPEAEKIGMKCFFTCLVEETITIQGSNVIALVRQAKTGDLAGGLLVPATAPWLRGPAQEVKDVCGVAAVTQQAGDSVVSTQNPGTKESYYEDMLVAKTLPPDAGLWAAALMRASKRSRDKQG